MHYSYLYINIIIHLAVKCLIRKGIKFFVLPQFVQGKLKEGAVCPFHFWPKDKPHPKHKPVHSFHNIFRIWSMIEFSAVTMIARFFPTNRLLNCTKLLAVHVKVTSRAQLKQNCL